MTSAYSLPLYEYKFTVVEQFRVPKTTITVKAVGRDMAIEQALKAAGLDNVDYDLQMHLVEVSQL